MDRPDIGTAEVVRADSRHLPQPDDSVDLIVTSPPYFALRSYQDGGEHYAGQVGDEPTPAEFIDSLLEVTRECVRVLKPSGSLWVNLGDKYVADNRGSGGDVKRGPAKHAPRGPAGFVTGGMRQKSLMGLPWRYAIRCIDELGLILRAEVIWSKPNGLPESVTDRVRRSHEQWFCFEQSGGVESAAQSFPFCPLCGRPVDARATLVARLKEVDRGVESANLPDHVRSEDGVDGQDARGGDHDVAVRLGGSPVPVLEALDAKVGVDAAHLVEDGCVPVVDADAKDRTALSAHQGDGAFAVDDASEPSDVCECVGHPVIVNDEPWIPQSLAAEIMQRVADGEIDPQQAADFLSGDYVRNHSVWFHFTLQPRYYSAVDTIREQHASSDAKVSGGGQGQRLGMAAMKGQTLSDAQQHHPLGKLPGSVWEIATQPLKVPDHLGIDHFAAFPMEWPRRIIRGWSPREVCTACGEGRRPIVSSVALDMSRPQARRAHEIATKAGLTEQHFEALLSVGVSDTGRGKATQSGTGKNTAEVYALADHARAALGGYAREYLLRRPTGFTDVCACPDTSAPTTPGVVLDPFGGTGTTALLAKANGRHGISVDMSADYCRLAEWRTTDPGQLAQAMQVDKPAEQVRGQGDLLSLIEEGA